MMLPPGEVYVWWIGQDTIDPALIGRLRDRLAATFERPVRVWSDSARPIGSLDPARGQHSSTRMLVWLADHRPAAAFRLLGVTDVDLFIPVLTFVYGEAQLGGRVALVSTARLRAAGMAGRGLTEVRLVTEAVHELGHTFGLLHCDATACAMRRSVGTAAIDGKRPVLCDACRLAYLEFIATREGGYDQGAHAHPRR